MVPSRSQSGFSLVELSIVLVILGLLTGGILGGQALIRAAELRSVSTEAQRYAAAVQTFRDKYFALPGDMTNATAFWGTMSSGVCPHATGGTGTQTCNGNGNGEINAGGIAGQSNEMYTFWQHLANAALITGTYSGIAGDAGAGDSEIGQNAPSSRVSNAGWHMQHFIDGNPLTNYDLPTSYANTFFFGADYPDFETGNKILAPEEAWNIDVKMDDGRPAYGEVIARFWNNECTDAAINTDLESDYRLQDKSAQCALFFKDLF